MPKKQAKKARSVDLSSPHWLITYADMVTLLLCFFVLLFSYSVVQETKWKALSGSLRAHLGYMPLATGVIPETRQRAPAEQAAEEAYRRGAPGEQLEVLTIREGKKIVIGGKVLFAAGSSALLPEGREVLRAAADYVRGVAHRLEIRGHSASGEAAAGGLEDDWELGWRRARAVAKYLVDECGVKEERLRMASGGVADPAAANLPPDEAHRNRRVEIVVTDEFVR